MTNFPLASGERPPDMNMTALIIIGDPAGAIIAVGLLIIGLIGILEARRFFFFSAIFGGLLGLILW
jgi:hypothetical protein